MVDLHCHSCYSFLSGASQPAELVAQAVQLGYTALALTDHNGVYGSLEFAHAAAEAGLQAITGAEVTLEDGSHLTLLVETAAGYANLCRLLTAAHRHGERRFPRLPEAMLCAHTAGLICLSGCPLGRIPTLLRDGRRSEAEARAKELDAAFGSGSFFLELQHNLVYGDTERCRQLATLGRSLGIPLVATNNTHYHVRSRWRLHDTLTAIRQGSTLAEARRRPNSEFALKSPAAFRARYAEYPEAIANAVAVAERCRAFDLCTDLGYQFPDFQREGGTEARGGESGKESADAALRALCEAALGVRFGQASPARQREARVWLENELAIISRHGLAGFFLVYRDLLVLATEIAAELRGGGPPGRFALPPARGRGSAVSSIVCYLIGLSPVDPIQSKLFPGRFLNDSLDSVPDIDLDLPREIRAALIERIHQHYGVDHVALVNIMPTFKFRGAVREVGKALGLPELLLDQLAKVGDGHSPVDVEMERLPAFAPLREQRLWRHLQELCREARGMPRHVSQHVGGIVISSRPLIEIVPVEHSAMEGRQLVQWDKDSCALARFIKVDLLALGMLSAVEECLELIAANGKEAPDLTRIDYADPRIYRRLARGDTVGAFQVESRAQIGMLVRTRPRTMDELAIQVAIVRPGPVVAGSVSPYVRRKEEQRTRRHYQPPLDHPSLGPILNDTLGVVIYQDQVLEIAKAAGGFNDGEADQFRRAMKRRGAAELMESYRTRFIDGARERGIAEAAAGRIFEQLLGFASYGFPKSHAHAFAVLAYQSVWLLEYFPAEFFASVISNQPMGFYLIDTLIQEGERRGIRFVPPDVNLSALGCTVSGTTVRLGLTRVQGWEETLGQFVLDERRRGGPFPTLADFVRRTDLPPLRVEPLILIGAFDGTGRNRRELLWELGLLQGQRPERRIETTEAGRRVVASQSALPLSTEQDLVTLARAGAWERMAHAYRWLRAAPDAHPLRYLRPLLGPEVRSIAELYRTPHNTEVLVAGIVTARQRPETARGIMFQLLEDETGMLNVIVTPEQQEKQRHVYRTVNLVVLRGMLERRTAKANLIASHVWPLPELLPDKGGQGDRLRTLLQAARTRSRDFR